MATNGDQKNQQGIPATSEAEKFFEELKRYVRDVETHNRGNEEIELIVMHGNERIWVSEIGCIRPTLLYFEGNDSGGNRAHLLTHYQTVQLQIKSKSTPLLSPKRKEITFTLRS